VDRTDLDQLTAIADRRAAAAHIAATQLRQVADDFMAVAAGYIAFRHAADALDTMGEADRALAAVFRRQALTARRPPVDEPPAVPAAGLRRVPGDDWREWTDEDFPDPTEASDGPDGLAPAEASGPNGRPVSDNGAVSDDWDQAPLVADIRLGAPPE
jgi:hypothetical protein